MIVYAFIFARGGSAGLPGKNIKCLGGIPLLGHSILMAQQLPMVKKIYVSTDSDEIAKVAEDYSAEVIRRPTALASNTASEWLAWRHAIEFLQERGEHFDVFLSLPTTSPLRIKKDVDACLALFSDETDMVITVTPSARSPYFNMVTREKAGISQIVNGDATIIRRQDVPNTYDMTTVAYVSRPSYIMQNASLFTGIVKSVIVPKERAVDIDDAVDFMFAETLFSAQSFLYPSVASSESMGLNLRYTTEVDDEFR